MKLTGKLLTVGLVAGGVVGALAVTNKLVASSVGELNTVLTGEERRYPWKYGDMFYQVKGNRDAKPLLLIHGFGPGASSYEWRKNVDTLAGQFRVYTIDLLGFGISDRPSVDYTAETYTDLIADFIKEVIGKPTVVVAHGLSCAYVIADAYRRSQLFERLVLVAPPTNMLQETSQSLTNNVWKSVLRMPILGQFVYNLLTSRRAIRGYYDHQGFYNPSLISDELVEYLFTSAHQQNSHYSIASFLSNYLTLDVHEAFARLKMPTTIVFGREGTLTPSEASDAFKQVNSRVDVRILDKCSHQPQDEQANIFNTLVREFPSAVAVS